MDFFACIFQGFQCLIDFLISIKNQVNKTKKTRKLHEKKICMKDIESIWLYIDFRST